MSGIAGTAAATPYVARSDARARSILWCVHAVLFAATSVVVGVIWDISWHSTIGRDSFWTPAHMAIYLGGVVAGCSCGALILRTTFAGTPAERASSVQVWGMRGPIGAWLCCWGAAAMITSAPLDDWWHNAYGLDVEILSPPHVVLALGIGGIVLGALLMAVAHQNRVAATHDAESGRSRWLPVYAAGVLIALVLIMATEFTARIRQHGPLFYQVACGVIPLYLVAMALASKLRWGATVSAAIYMGLMMLQGWILPLFPGTPRLGPIFYPVTHMVPMTFPLVLIIPALAVDLVLQRAERRGSLAQGRGRRWLVALVLAVAFFAALVAVQWPFSTFMLSKASYNWFFFGDNWSYGNGPNSFHRRGLFVPGPTGFAFVRGMVVAVALGVLSSRLGIAWGSWMREVRR